MPANNEKNGPQIYTPEPDAGKSAQALTSSQPADSAEKSEAPVELGGPAGPDPVRFGDWERKGRCIDF